MKRIFVTLLFIVSVIIAMQGVTLASEYNMPLSYSGIEEKAMYIQTAGIPTVSKQPQLDSNLNQLIGVVWGIVQYICYGAAFIVLVIKGVQFMNAAPEAKAQIKKQMIAIVIGVVLVFAISGVLNIIMNVTQSLF